MFLVWFTVYFDNNNDRSFSGACIIVLSIRLFFFFHFKELYSANKRKHHHVMKYMGYINVWDTYDCYLLPHLEITSSVVKLFHLIE